VSGADRARADCERTHDCTGGPDHRSTTAARPPRAPRVAGRTRKARLPSPPIRNRRSVSGYSALIRGLLLRADTSMARLLCSTRSGCLLRGSREDRRNGNVSALTADGRTAPAVEPAAVAAADATT